MTDVTDNFNRANGAFGSDWLDSTEFTAASGGVFGIVSNAAKVTGGSNWQAAYWNPASNTFSADQHAQITLVGNSGGPVVRHQATHSSGYLVIQNNGIYRFDNASFTNLTTGSSPTGSTIQLSATGSTISSVLGAGTGSASDTTYPSGQPGLACDATGSVDDWGGGPVVVTTQTLTPNLVAGDDAFFAPVVAATATLLPALATDADTFAVPTVLATATLLPAPVSDADSFYAPSLSTSAGLLPGLVADSDVVPVPVVASGAAPTVLQPQLVADNDNIYGAAVTYLPILRPAFFNAADLFYPASLVGGIPVVKHALTGSIRRPVLAGNLGSRRVLTGTLKRVG
jgi:hypothetical protein